MSCGSAREARLETKIPDYARFFFGEQSFERCAEQFRNFALASVSVARKRPIRTLLITSASPGEGKIVRGPGISLKLSLASTKGGPC